VDAPHPLTAAQLFDAIGSDYDSVFGSPRMIRHAVRELLELLPPNARVLDIGSGTGYPVAHDLVTAGHCVTGLDVSAAMIEIARARVPGATFLHVDVREWTSPDSSWDAVCAFFPFLQMSRQDTAGVLAGIARWLVPGGYLMAVTVPLDGEDVPGEFLGHPVAITSFTPPALVARVEAVGLQVVDTQLERFQPDQPGAAAEDHLLIVARRPVPDQPAMA
jgi:ubiquinone/menaquinone biosynthesis C-methylase UbiE